jgi:hypothetical protein
LRLVEALRLPFGARISASLILGAFIVAFARLTFAESVADWPYTEGAAGGGRYSALTDINRGNVGRLKVAWTYRHGDFRDGGWRPDHINRGTSFDRLRSSSTAASSSPRRTTASSLSIRRPERSCGHSILESISIASSPT